MSGPNPLIAKPKETTTGVTGIGIAESAVDLANGISDGSWVEGGLGALGVGLEMLSMVIDPVGTVLQYGVSWLIEHVEPLKEALDWFAGDPPVIQSFSDTWANVAAEVNAVAADLQNEAKGGTAGWEGTAADAYRGQSAEQADAIAGAGALADGISGGVMVMGMVVAAVRELVRDLVAELVAKLITWALEAVATLGLGTPVIVAQATAAIAKVTNRISDLVRKLIKTIGNVTPRLRKVIDKLGEIMEKLSKIGRKLDGGTTPSGVHGPKVDAPSVKSPDTPTTPSSSTTPSGTTSPDAPSTKSPDTTSPSSTSPDGTPGSTSPSGSKSPDGSPSSNRPANPRDTSSPVNGRRCKNDPIDVATGEMVLHQVDVELPGVLPLILARTHVSSYRAGRSFGPSWASSLDQRLEFDADGILFVADEGVILAYPRAAGDGAVLPAVGAQWPLQRTADGYVVAKPELGQSLQFVDTGGAEARLVAISDRNGNRMDLRYGPDGGLAEVNHSGGYRIGVERADGLVTGLRLLSSSGGADVPLMSFGYSEDGRLRQVVNSSRRALKFDYDAAGRIVRWEDRNAQWYSYVYDERGRCGRNEGSGGFLAGSFDYHDGRTDFTNSLGHRTSFQLNAHGQVVREIDPLGNTTASEWDEFDRLLSRTDPLGRTVRYHYDDDGNLVTLVRPDGSEATATYNAFRSPVTTTEPGGAQWRTEYDARGNVIAETDPLGATTSYAYTDGGGLASITDPLGNVLTVQTDAAGLPIAVTNPLGATTRYVRDVFGRVVQIVDAVGGVTRFTWTIEGKMLSRTLPDGATEFWRYDGEGNQLEHVDPLGQATRHEYSGFDQLAARTGPDGTRFEFGYDTQLQLASVTNPNGRAWRYQYDAAGRLVSETDFDGRTLAYAHDAAGQLIERRNGAGEVVRFGYDALGEMTEKHAPGGMTTFRYDGAGRLVRAADADAELVVRRDALGRVVAESVNGRTLTSEYDLAGRRTRRISPSGAQSIWEYDAGGQVAALHTAGRTMTFGYDPARREIWRNLGAGAVLAQQWDANHRLISQVLRGPDRPAPAQARQYHYRPDGHLVGVSDQVSGPRRFELNSTGRVTAVQGSNWAERYAYDPVGDIVSADLPSPHSAADGAPATRESTRLPERHSGGAHYRRDEQGRVTARQRRTLSGQVQLWRYTWDAEDRLTGVTTPDGVSWRYLYDPLGRRMAKQRLGRDGSIVEQTDFTWDGVLLAERSQPGTATTWNWDAETTRPLTQTERSARQDAPQEWFDREFYSLITDIVGTPVEMVDGRGEIAWRAQTTVWGSALAGLSGGPSCPLRFPGQYHDAETGLHYNYFRYYDPSSGAYCSADPLGLAGGTNPYAFVANPSRQFDLLGLSATDCARAALDKLPADKRDEILYRIVRGDKKGRPFGSPRNPDPPSIDEFNPRWADVRAGDLQGSIASTKHGVYPDQASRVGQLSNDDLLAVRMDDPLSATSSDAGFGLTGGHHRSAEIAARVTSGQLSPDAIVRILVHD